MLYIENIVADMKPLPRYNIHYIGEGEHTKFVAMFVFECQEVFIGVGDFP